MKCDADTFARMYEAVYQDLYRFALCLLRDRHEAEDAVGESVLAAYENIRKLRDEKAFKNWIFTILANVCRKRLRKRGRELSLDQADTFFNVPASQEDQGLAIDVKRAFFILSEEEQMIVALSVFGGYTSREIGKMLKVNENTVRSKRSRALEKMECVLE
ncbi:MAG TPA: sigma-70 family RNA polymerase sigma factor [Candidatus Dorea gallistercoris]|uniref:Sigma-70 family RNA polymerase sigma factor n=1 Tax=Candidatus Dorea gallistercoris TaxID=2838542 RepID=A0A9D1R8M1_9FIRM|nr:sigma-70 family RNA polymerase sigma factor [Candidatus Dorea gallistercoris]